MGSRSNQVASLLMKQKQHSCTSEAWCCYLFHFCQILPFLFDFCSEMVWDGSKLIIVGGNHSQRPYGDFLTDSGRVFFDKTTNIRETSRGQTTVFVYG